MQVELPALEKAICDCKTWSDHVGCGRKIGSAHPFVNRCQPHRDCKFFVEGGVIMNLGYSISLYVVRDCVQQHLDLGYTIPHCDECNAMD